MKGALQALLLVALGLAPFVLWHRDGGLDREPREIAVLAAETAAALALGLGTVALLDRIGRRRLIPGREDFTLVDRFGLRTRRYPLREITAVEREVRFPLFGDRKVEIRLTVAPPDRPRPERLMLEARSAWLEEGAPADLLAWAAEQERRFAPPAGHDIEDVRPLVRKSVPEGASSPRGLRTPTTDSTQGAAAPEDPLGQVLFEHGITWKNHVSFWIALGLGLVAARIVAPAPAASAAILGALAFLLLHLDRSFGLVFRFHERGLARIHRGRREEILYQDVLLYEYDTMRTRKGDIFGYVFAFDPRTQGRTWKLRIWGGRGKLEKMEALNDQIESALALSSAAMR